MERRTRHPRKEREQLQHHFGVSRQRESWRHTEWHTHRSELGVRHAYEDEDGRNAGHKRLAAEQNRVIDTVSVDNVSLLNMTGQRSVC